MSAQTENLHHEQHDQHMMKSHSQPQQHDSRSSSGHKDSDKHPLHQFDLSIMTRLYESCLAKASEQGMIAPNWRPDEWAKERHERPHDWSSPIMVGQKQRVHEAFARLAREHGEPMILMPNFDFGDIVNFERFLDALKVDGINAIGRYKQYLNSRDIRKLEIDLVVVHPVHGIMLIETKESDMFDNKKRARARAHLNAARQAFEAVLRLILEANGMKHSESQLPVYQFVALPNVREMPMKSQSPKGSQQGQSSSSGVENANTSSSSIGSMSSPSSSSSRPSRALNYLIKSDLDDQNEFAQWWKRAVEEPSRLLAEARREEEEKEREKRASEEKKDERKEEREKKMISKKDMINQMMGLMACVRNNSLMPVVYPEMEGMMMSESGMMMEREQREKEEREKRESEKRESDKESSEKEKEMKERDEKLHLNQPAMNIYAEFMRPEHERARALSKCVVLSRDMEQIRRTICLQAMWLLLNDSQKKISVVTSEANRPYYEEFFARQRKVYTNLNNLRFYIDIHSCDPSQHTLKRDGEIWFFDAGVTMKTDSGVQQASLNDIMTRVKDLPSYWIFTEQYDQVGQHQHELGTMNVKNVDLDERKHHHHHEQRHMDMSQMRIKLPMRLTCDLLIVGDLIAPIQLKYLYKHLKSTSVLNQMQAYRADADHDKQSQQQPHHHQKQSKQDQYVQLKFNPMKRFRSVKFIRGGTIENVRNALKMHDSIQAPVVFMHVGDEDLFKNRQSMTAIERIKELGTLMREYCPKSFIAISTLMRRQSRTENGVISEVNKGITTFCKQTKESLNVHYMLNNHFDPEFHTQSGRVLTGKGLKLFADNLLFTVDHFHIRNNKQQ